MNAECCYVNGKCLLTNIAVISLDVIYVIQNSERKQAPCTVDLYENSFIAVLGNTRFYLDNLSQFKST